MNSSPMCTFPDGSVLNVFSEGEKSVHGAINEIINDEALSWALGRLLLHINSSPNNGLLVVQSDLISTAPYRSAASVLTLNDKTITATYLFDHNRILSGTAVGTFNSERPMENRSRRELLGLLMRQTGSDLDTIVLGLVNTPVTSFEIKHGTYPTPTILSAACGGDPSIYHYHVPAFKPNTNF